jgi:hypothetical protein
VTRVPPSTRRLTTSSFRAIRPIRRLSAGDGTFDFFETLRRLVAGGEALRHGFVDLHKDVATGVHGVGAGSVESTAHKGVANGYASLGSDGKLPTAQLPALAISDTFVVASQAAMLALAAQRGDIAIRTDVSKTFMLTSDNPGTLADWLELEHPDAVTSVDGATGVVVLPSDGAAGTATKRSLGAGATQACAGNDARLSDTRVPTDGSVTNAKVAAGAAIDEAKLNLASDAAAGTASRRTLGTGATQACAGNDARLSDTRTPTDNSVTTAKLVDANVTRAKLAAGLYLPDWTAGRYYTPPILGTPAGATLGNGNCYLMPIRVPNAYTLVRIGAKVTIAGAAGSVIRLGIFNDNGSGLPGALLLDAGTIDGTSATAQEITISQAVGAGVLWLALCGQGAPVGNPAVTFIPTGGGYPEYVQGAGSLGNAFIPIGALFQGGVTGALPANASGLSDAGTGPVIAVRRS